MHYHLKERVGRSAAVGAILDLGLLGEVVGRVDRRLHLLRGEEGGQVGRVRRDHDEGEEPPNGGDHARRNGPKKETQKDQSHVFPNYWVTMLDGKTSC